MAPTLRDITLTHQLVWQFLQVQGYTETLAAFNDEAPARFLDPVRSAAKKPASTASAAPCATSNDQTAYREQANSALLPPPTTTVEDLVTLVQELTLWRQQRESARAQTQEQVLLDVGTGYYPHQTYEVFERLHGRHNILCAQLHSLPSPEASSQLVLLTSGTDKRVLVTEIDSGRQVHTFDHHQSSPVLSLAVSSTNPIWMATGAMDGSMALVDLAQGTIVQWFKKLCTRFIVRVQFSQDGQYLACASYDHTIHVFQQASKGAGHPFVPYKTFRFTGAIESLCFAPAPTAQVDRRSVLENSSNSQPAAHDTLYLLCGVRNDPFVHYIELATGAQIRYSLLGRGAFKDDAMYCPFTPMDLSLSPCGQYLCVSTDDRTPAPGTGELGSYTPRAITLTKEGGRVIVFRAFTDTIVRQFYNAHSGSDSLTSYPRHCWDASGRYIYVNGEPDTTEAVSRVAADRLERTDPNVGDGDAESEYQVPNAYTMQVLELATGSIVDTIHAHQGLIRALWSNPCSPLLAPYVVSASFDKSVIVWK
ncbi:hypothetical protein H4R34_002948 [Dimargaris verticillata]|uniref:WD40-repeat-containing domain protein n=1 Tax=Dimargaris verticillata TaxID=2761393 RepID=A0A9W8B314_9FUNG|nr:hypothetical protein H4R34_002948 [Dimargaris verticillata]